MDHGLPQILGAGLSLVMAHAYGMSRTILLNNQRVINRKVLRGLFERAHRIPAGGHDIVEQRVCLRHGRFRVIYKSRLYHTPRIRKACAIGGRQWTDMESLHAFLDLSELCLGTRTTASF